MLAPGGITSRILSFGMVVVDAVDDEVHARADRMVGLPVEHLAVEPVLGKGPEHAGRRGPGATLSSAARAAVDAEPDEADDHGHEDQRGDGRVDPREEVEEPGLEERRGRAEAGCSLLRHRR